MLDNLHYLAQLDFVVTTKSVACRVFRRRRMPPSKDRRLVGRGVGVGAFTPCVDILSLNFFGVGIGLGCGFGLGWGFGGESFNCKYYDTQFTTSPRGTDWVLGLRYRWWLWRRRWSCVGCRFRRWK